MQMGYEKIAIFDQYLALSRKWYKTDGVALRGALEIYLYVYVCMYGGAKYRWGIIKTSNSLYRKRYRIVPYMEGE